MKLRPGVTSGRAMTAFLLCALLLLTSATYSIIIFIALSSEWAFRNDREATALSSWHKVEVGTTITVVRALQGLLSALSSALLARFLLYLKWGLIRRPNGVSFQSMLAVSPTTLDLGTYTLALAMGPRFSTRFWAVLRYVAEHDATPALSYAAVLPFEMIKC
jgi:hypothetical protein